MPTLSHSQMETFAQCPRRWRLEKLDRVPRAPAPALILGDAFHQAIEADGKAFLLDGIRLSYHELLEQGIATLTARLDEDDPQGCITREDTNDLSARLAALVRAYAEHVQLAYAPLQVEAALTVPLADGWDFTGRLDGVTARGVVDFKTASKPWPVGAEHHKPQASAYTWLWHRATGERPQQVAFLVFSTARQDDGTFTCSVERRVTTRTHEQQMVWLGTAQATARRIEVAAETGEYPASPGPLCGWCGVLGACGVGAQWLNAHGRTPAVPVLAAVEAQP